MAISGLGKPVVLRFKPEKTPTTIKNIKIKKVSLEFSKNNLVIQ